MKIEMYAGYKWKKKDTWHRINYILIFVLSFSLIWFALVLRGWLYHPAAASSFSSNRKLKPFIRCRLIIRMNRYIALCIYFWLKREKNRVELRVILCWQNKSVCEVSTSYIHIMCHVPRTTYHQHRQCFSQENSSCYSTHYERQR